MDSTFFTKFIMITNLKTIIFVVVLIALLYGIYKLEKAGVNFSKRMLISTGIGLLLGFIIQFIAGFPSNTGDAKWIGEVTKWYSLVGNGFMDLLKMLVVPLVFLSMLRVIITMDEKRSLGKLTSRSIFVLLGTTAISSVVAIIIAVPELTADTTPLVTVATLEFEVVHVTVLFAEFIGDTVEIKVSLLPIANISVVLFKLTDLTCEF